MGRTDDDGVMLEYLSEISNALNRILDLLEKQVEHGDKENDE